MIHFVQRISLGLEIRICHCFSRHTCFLSAGPLSLVSSVNLTSASVPPSTQSKVSITIPASFVTLHTFHTSLFCLQHITQTSSYKTAIEPNSLVIHYLFLKNVKKKKKSLIPSGSSWHQIDSGKTWTNLSGFCIWIQRKNLCGYFQGLGKTVVLWES